MIQWENSAGSVGVKKQQATCTDDWLGELLTPLSFGFLIYEMKEA